MILIKVVLLCALITVALSLLMFFGWLAYVVIGAVIMYAAS